MIDFVKKRPSAYIPILMSIGALTIPWVWVFIFGPDPTRDEGGAAHIFQILMFGQLPVILYFLFRYFREKPKQTFKVIVIQTLLIVTAFLPVYILEH